MPKQMLLQDITDESDLPRRLANARSHSFMKRFTEVETLEMMFPCWLGTRISQEGTPQLLRAPYEISWTSRILDSCEAQRFSAWVQTSQQKHGLLVTGPCSWCGLPTGDVCEWCPSTSGPESRLCSICGWRIGQCRLCRMSHVKNGLRTIIPPAGSATYGTHRCAVCERQGIHLNHCVGCCVFRYCSRECQKKNWKDHKLVCSLFQTFENPKQEHLHFIYSWQLSRLPSVIPRLPHGICRSTLNAHNVVCAGFPAELELKVAHVAIPLIPLGSFSQRQQRQAAKHIMRKAHVEFVPDKINHMYMGIPLQDGVGEIDPELVYEQKYLLLYSLDA